MNSVDPLYELYSKLLKGDYIGDYIRNYYRGHEGGILRVQTTAHICIYTYPKPQYLGLNLDKP